MNLIFLIDVLRISIKGLSEKKLRSALTIIGISIGPLALIMMTSVVMGYSNYAVKQVETLGQNLILIEPKSGYTLTQNDLNLIRSIHGVKKAEPIYIISAMVKVGTEKKEVMVIATDISIFLESMSGLKIKEGVVPSSCDIIKAVIGYDIAFKGRTQYYNVGDAITIYYYKPRPGSGVEIRRATVLISGIFDKFGGALLLSPDKAIMMSTEAGRRVFGMNQWTGIIIEAKSVEYVKYIVQELKNQFGDSVDIISFEGIAKVVESVTASINFVTFATSLSAFAVAVAGVASTMITSVIERTREIGVMKALGFTNRQVLIMVLAESLVMSLIGGSIGIALGIIGAHLLAQRGLVIKSSITKVVIYVPPAITPQLILQTIAITILVGVLGGLFPAYQAAKIPPAVALRYE